MSEPCRERLCEAWYINSTMACLSCVTDHVSGTELENFASIIDIYNSTCNNRSLVVSSVCGAQRGGQQLPAQPGRKSRSWGHYARS
jgi:hypothetical protein